MFETFIRGYQQHTGVDYFCFYRYHFVSQFTFGSLKPHHQNGNSIAGAIKCLNMQYNMLGKIKWILDVEKLFRWFCVNVILIYVTIHSHLILHDLFNTQCLKSLYILGNLCRITALKHLRRYSKIFSFFQFSVGHFQR